MNIDYVRQNKSAWVRAYKIALKATLIKAMKQNVPSLISKKMNDDFHSSQQTKINLLKNFDKSE